MDKRKLTTKKGIAGPLRSLMKSKNLTQQQVAADAGVSQPTVAAWLNGATPTAVNLENLAIANGVSTGFFLQIDPKSDERPRGLIDLGIEQTPPVSIKNAFDNVSESAKLYPVKALLPGLLERLKEATKERGKKTALAKFLGVPLSNVSQYLAGDREPGGETTLKMLYWVEHPECQQ
jgi:transcriptional regulator with XRE-family HTH domain